MKKFLSIILGFILILSLAACENTSSEDTESANTEPIGSNEATPVVSGESSTAPENVSTGQAADFPTQKERLPGLPVRL